MASEQVSNSADRTAEIAREFLSEVVAAMELHADVEAEVLEDGSYRLEVVGEDAGEVVGRYGDTLNALQYLVTLVTQKRSGQYVRLTIDADGYRERRHAALVDLARELADQVAQSGNEAELDPLNPFERRIIHNCLLDHPDVVTYSEGEEPERYVVIAPRPRAEESAG